MNEVRSVTSSARTWPRLGVVVGLIIVGLTAGYCGVAAQIGDYCAPSNNELPGFNAALTGLASVAVGVVLIVVAFMLVILRRSRDAVPVFAAGILIPLALFVGQQLAQPSAASCAGSGPPSAPPATQPPLIRPSS